MRAATKREFRVLVTSTITLFFILAALVGFVILPNLPISVSAGMPQAAPGQMIIKPTPAVMETLKK